MEGTAMSKKQSEHCEVLPASETRVLLSASRAHIFTHETPRWRMASIDTNKAKIVTLLKPEDWVKVPGGKHDKYMQSTKPGLLIVVPRHTSVAGWP
jgi:hypothetical protein